jgi:hypothetical protein
LAFLLPILAAVGAGRLLAHAMRVQISPSLLLAAGTPLLSLLIFLTIALRIAKPLVVLPLCAVLALASLWPLRRPALRIPLLAAVSFFPLAAYYAVHAFAPEIQPDGAGYHTGVVADWLRNGRFPSVPGFYDILPLGLETVFLPAFALGRHTAAKLVHFTFFLACVPLILRIAKQFEIDGARAWSAALLFFAAPVAAVSGTSSYNDAAFVLFHLAAFSLLLEADSPKRAALAGLAAGFCYAIKIPGLIAPFAGAVYLLARRQPRYAAAFAAASLAGVAPWMLRALLSTGNPIAPLANSLFPNFSFHPSADAALAFYFRTYGGIDWTDIPRSLSLGGGVLQGLFGPALLLLPLSLLSLRRTAGRWLLAAACLSAIPWLSNHGARFLLPAWAFLALALCLALPSRAAVAVALLQLLACTPWALNRYSDPYAWRLRGFPWEAALRLESEHAYLSRHYWEFRIAQLVNKHAKPGETVLDLFGVPSGYLNSLPLGPLPNRDYTQIAETLKYAALPIPEPIGELRCRFPARFLRAVRVRVERPFSSPFGVADIAAHRNGEYLAPLPLWFANAWPAAIDSTLAADGALASRWSTLAPAAPGMFVDLVFDRPVPLDGVSAFIPFLEDARSVAVYGLNHNRTWTRLSANAELRRLPLIPQRASAGALLKSRGIRWIVAPIAGSGLAPVGASLFMTPGAYRLTLAAHLDNVALFRVD